MANSKAAVSLGRKIMTGLVASSETDPMFYSKLGVLPNPDPILRRIGMVDQTYDAIMADPHVIGEIRTMRASLISYKFRIKAGGDQLRDQQAYELCKRWYNSTRPAQNTTWDDVRWNIFSAILFGMRVHELDWQYQGGHWLPVQILDRPNRRFVYNPERQIRLLTRQEPTTGIEIEPYRFVITRHMPTDDDPYGCALLSSCFWPYTFKHGGWRFFYNFCEKFGMPWPIGRYPQGAQPKEQGELLDALVNLARAGAAAVPEGSSVELLTASHSGELAQQALIELCNREMSKALTSQTLATELQGVGSNAAAQTHSQRQGGNSLADRNMVLASFNEILRWITEFNFGTDVAAPVAEFYKPERATPERMQAIKSGVEMGLRISKRGVLDELQVAEAADDDDVMTLPASNSGPGLAFSQSSCPSCGSHHQFAEQASGDVAQATQAADDVIEKTILQPAFEMLQRYEQQGKSLAQWLADLPRLFGTLDDDQLADINEQVLLYALAKGTAESRFMDDA